MANGAYELLNSGPSGVEEEGMRDGSTSSSITRVLRARALAALLIVVAAVAALVPALASPATSAPVRKVSAWLPYWNQTQAYNSFVANADLYDEAHLFLYEMKSTTTIQ